MLKHAQIWNAIDRLAARNGLSPSGPARKAGLSATVFNPSKRTTGKRKRWPSTESIARILQATGTGLDSFVALATTGAPGRARLPLLGLAEAAREGVFDDSGLPAGPTWDEMPLPVAADPAAFALEITGRALEPLYREGDRIIASTADQPRRGDRVVARTRTGELLVRRMGREGGQKIELLGLSSDHPPVTLAKRDLAWVARILWASQ